MLTRLDLRGSDVDPRVALGAVSTSAEEPVALVREIIEDVRARGDDALRDLTARFDGCTVDQLRVPPADLQTALASTDADLRTALETAVARIRGYHEAQSAAQGPVALDTDGVSVEELLRPVDRAGLYVPGGRAVYPSSVLMTAIPAAVAGVAEIALCVPPDEDGEIPAVTLAAAAIVGVTEVYRVGGAQAIAALVYGTESIPAADVIVGPGNVYVSVAKREVVGAGVVGIESPAGPSELVVVVGEHAPAHLVAADLAAQAEHGPGGTAVIVTWSEAVASAVERALETIVADAPRRDEMVETLAAGGRVVLVRDEAQAMAVVNWIAPEHLEIVTDDPDALLPLVRNAGAVFLGPYAPTALGDYAAGANHVLPTGRSARFASALRVDDFRKHVHVVRASPEGSAALSRSAAVIARAEGLDAHAHSLDLRADLVSPESRGERIQPRDDLRALEGYHSPQLDVSVRLNTNESPFAPPPAFMDAWLDGLRAVQLNRYPDRGARALRSAIGESLGQPPTRVFCANGSNEVLQTLLLTYGGPGRRALVFEPTYALHAHIARITGSDLVIGTRGDDFAVDVDAARALIDEHQPDVVFLCSPNNPTGTVEDLATVHAILDAAPGLVVVDEAYGEFARHSALDLVDDERPLVVVRTYSKVWSLAALRLGFCVAPPWVVAELEKVVLPYHLAADTQVAGTTTLQFRTEMRERVAFLIEERERLLAALREMDRITVFESGSNFLLFRVAPGDGRTVDPAHIVWQALVERGVLVRDFSHWPGVEDCLRVTVGTAAENTAFLSALSDVLRDDGQS